MSDSIQCPNCGENIDVNQLFVHKTEEKYKSLLLEEKKRVAAEHKAKEEALQKQQAIFEEKKKKENEIFQQRLNKEKEALKEDLAKRMEHEYKTAITAQKEELAEKEKKLQQLKQTEIDMERLKRRMEDQKKDMELEYEKRIIKERSEYEEQIIKREQERMSISNQERDMKMKEQMKLIEDLKVQLEETKRKAEQGSMQLQGEVQELAIEEFLAASFPLDTITEIKKGQRGADCIQTVNDLAMANCGTIYYESKRTKDFSNEWITKLKADMRAKGADIGVIVTKAMPRDMKSMGEKEGVWICNFEEFKGLSYVLRQSIIRVASERVSNENRGDKMAMLYQFLTSNEFRMQVEGIVEGFKTMKSDLDRERRAMEKLWKQREKQLEKVIYNTTSMYGSIKGIAGAAVQKVEYLELPDGDDD